VILQDKPFIAVDNTGGSRNGRMYISWTSWIRPPGDYWTQRINLSYSTNQGALWAAPFIIHQIYPAADPPSVSPQDGSVTESGYEYIHWSMPAVAPNGDVYVTWLHGEQRTFRANGYIRIRRSTNGGSSFQNPVTVAGPFSIADYLEIGNLRASSMATLAADPSSENIYVAYTQWIGGSTGHTDICFTRSTDWGMTWSTPTISTERTDNDQFFPWLAVSPSGTISLVYYDGYLVGGTSEYVRAKVAQSYNKGVSFNTPNSTLTSLGFDPHSGVHHSDYIGIATSGISDVFAVWTDFRTTTNEDIYGSVDKRPVQPQNLSWSGQPGQHPTFTWTANTESDLAGYNIYRFDPTIGNNGLWVKLNTALITTNSYTDNSITLSGGGNPSHYEYYRVQAVDQQQLESVPSEQVEVLATGLPLEKHQAIANAAPSRFALHQNYPNPFNPSTQIRYELPDAGFVSLVVYDVLGRKIAELVNEYREVGHHTAMLNAANLASGVYIARLTVSNNLGKVQFTKVNKLVLAK
jgi:hypothetical protein